MSKKIPPGEKGGCARAGISFQHGCVRASGVWGSCEPRRNEYAVTCLCEQLSHPTKRLHANTQRTATHGREQREGQTLLARHALPRHIRHIVGRHIWHIVGRHIRHILGRHIWVTLHVQRSHSRGWVRRWTSGGMSRSPSGQRVTCRWGGWDCGCFWGAVGRRMNDGMSGQTAKGNWTSMVARIGQRGRPTKPGIVCAPSLNRLDWLPCQTRHCAYI